MVVPNFYINSGEGAIASYDFFDFVRRVGYKKFYACAHTSSGTTDYFLSIDPNQSNPVASTFSGAVGGTNNVYTTKFDLDFDLYFNSPSIIGGDVIINSTMDIYDSAVAGNITGKFIYTLYHVTSGGTETSLGSAYGEEVTVQNASQAKRDCVLINIANTSFAIGEQLRLNIVVQAKSDDVTGADKILRLWYDGGNRAVSTYDEPTPISAKADTDLSVLLPFKIDL